MARKEYDRMELLLPLGTKDLIKFVSVGIGISVNEYINRLIKQDLKKDHKSEDLVTMLKRWTVQEKYHPMIEEACYASGYYIKLKPGYINDGSDEILCNTTRELRHIMQYTHPVRDNTNGFDERTYEQLLKWQVPKCYYKDIKDVGNHEIIFKNGDTWKFKSVAELRYNLKSRS